MGWHKAINMRFVRELTIQPDPETGMLCVCAITVRNEYWTIDAFETQAEALDFMKEIVEKVNRGELK